MWCPKHRYEFINPTFTVCPSCGSPLVAERPQDDDLQEPAPAAASAFDETVTASRLGSFDRLAAPALLDLLGERGIRAFEAQPLANPATRGIDPMKTDVWVETERLDEAQRIAAEELDAFIRDTVVPDEPFEEAAVDPDDDEIEWSTFGWMETHVAIVFLDVCEEEAISARTEYPLDKPPPVWVTPGMRVQVFVDAFFVDEAEQLLERVEGRLDERGIAWVDPLCDLSGP